MAVLPETILAAPASATTTMAPAPTGPMALLLLTQGKYAGFNAWPKGYVPPNMRGDPNYKVEERGQELFIVLLVFTSLMVAMVIGRLWARWKVSGWYGSDDWWIIPATIFGVGHAVDLCIGAKRGGLGKHSWELSYEEVKVGVAINYPNLMLYAACMACVKNSLLCFIRRLAGPAASRRMVWTIWGMGIFFTCHAIASITTIVLWCLPVRSNWDFDARYLPNNPNAMCHDLHIWYWVSSGIHVVSDVSVLFLPIKMTWNLHISPSKKMGIIAMFSLGSIACICSMIRMGYIVPYVTSVDITWDSWPIALFGHLETAFAIITACVPAMKPLLCRYIPSWFSSINSSPQYNTSILGTGNTSKFSESYIQRHPAKIAAKQAALRSPQKPWHQMSLNSILNTTRGDSESDRILHTGQDNNRSVYSAETRTSVIRPVTPSYHVYAVAGAPKPYNHQDYINQRRIEDKEWGVNITDPRTRMDEYNDDRPPPVPPKDR